MEHEILTNAISLGNIKLCTTWCFDFKTLLDQMCSDAVG